MAEYSSNKLTADQAKIFQNLTDMFEEFIPMSTIKEVVKQNNYNLDDCLAALLKVAGNESGGRNSSPDVKSRRNKSKTRKTPTTQTTNQHNRVASPHSSKMSGSSRNRVPSSNQEAEGIWKVKSKERSEPRSRVQSHSTQPHGPLPFGYSNLRPLNPYQGPRVTHQLPRPQYVHNVHPNHQRFPTAGNPRQGPFNPQQQNPAQYYPQQQNPAPCYPLQQNAPRHYPQQQNASQHYPQQQNPAPYYPQQQYPSPHYSSGNQPIQIPYSNYSNSCPSSPARSLRPESSTLKDPKDVEMAKTYDKVYKIVNDGFKIMILMRGCPGSGKSHAANEIIHSLFGKTENPKKYIFGADDYFINAQGVYNFNPENLSQAHRTTQAKVMNALRSGISPVIIDNTNTQTWEMQIYVTMAVAWGYYLEILEPLTSWKFDAKMLFRKNIHNIPLYKVRDMLDRYERNVTGQKLLDLNSTKYSPQLTPPQVASNSVHKKFVSTFKTTSKSPDVSKAEKAVNRNISEMMSSFFKNNPPGATRRDNPVSKETCKPDAPSSQKLPNADHLSENQPFSGKFPPRLKFSSSKISSMHSPNSFSALKSETESESPQVFNKSKLSKLVDGLTGSLSASQLSEDQIKSALKKTRRKLKKPRKRKKAIPDFSKDYVVVLHDKSFLYQRNYDDFKIVGESLEKNIVGNSNLDEKKAEKSIIPDLNPHSSSDFVADKFEIFNTASIVDKGKDASASESRPLESIASKKCGSVYSSTSTLGGLVAYELNSDSDSTAIGDDHSFSSDDDDVLPSDTDVGSDGVEIAETSSKPPQENQSHLMSFSTIEGTAEFLEANPDGFLESWDQSQKVNKNQDLDHLSIPKPPRKLTPSLLSPVGSVSSDRNKESCSEMKNEGKIEDQEEIRIGEDKDWNTMNDTLAVLNSWQSNSEVSTEELVEKFLKNLKEPRQPSSIEGAKLSAPLNRVETDNIATSTDYDQVLNALQGNSSDCTILDCKSRDINEGILNDLQMQLQQRLHINKSTMTEDSIPIVSSSNVDISYLNKVFPQEISSSIIGLIDYCKGDINAVISTLIDGGYEITPEQFEVLASIPKNCVDVSSNDIKVPVKVDTRPPKVATPLPKPKVKSTPSESALRLKEEFESKIRINPDSYPEHVQFLKRQRERQQQFPTISESIIKTAPDESLVFVVDKNFIDQLQQKFGTIDLPYVKDFADLDSVVRIPSSIAFQLYGCVLEAAEENFSQQERLMQEMIASDEELAKQIQDQESDRNRKTELIDIMDMKLALQLYEADLKAWKTSGAEETLANILSRQLLYEMFPSMDRDTLAEMYRMNNFSFHNTIQMMEEKCKDNFAQLSPDIMLQKKDFPTKTPPSVEVERDEVTEEEFYSIEDYKAEQNYHYQMRTKCYNQAREAYNSGKSQVASYFSQLAFLHKQKMEKASAEIIKIEINNNSTDTLDLHFFAAKEAVLALDIFLDSYIKRLRGESSKPTNVTLYIITGRGTHSAGGVPKVKPAVIKRLKQRKIWYECTAANPGFLSVTVHKDLKLSTHFQEDS